MSDRRQKKQEEEVKLMKQKMQKEKEIQDEYKKKLMPLVKFLKKQGLTFNYAKVGSNRIQYFRGDELAKIREDKKQKISNNPNLVKLFEEINNHIIFFKRPEDSKNLKYPHVLQFTQSSDKNAKFCSFKFDTTTSKKGLMIGIIIAIIVVILFPIWPFSVKYGIWLVSLYLLVFLVGLIIFRLVIYMLCVICGFDVWILPNLFAEEGFIDSFKPFIFAARWEKSLFNIIIRVGAFLFLALYGTQLYLDPTLIDSHVNVFNSMFKDVHDWGVLKIKNQVVFSERAITNLDKILNETADVENQNFQQAKVQQKNETINQEIVTEQL